jgi:ABC-2 type transport system ATP-binding protein
MSDLFRAENITKHYGDFRALNNVSISIPARSIYGLLGPNGAGKTTLIRIINQIIAPDTGSLLLDNEPLHPRDVQQIGYLPEERGLYKKMKVGEQAIYLAQLKGLTESQARKSLKTWFDKFSLLPWWNKKVEELSKGMQQKVQFIITVLHNPRLLIFDEPFSGFDPINVNLLKQEILELRKAGATIIFSTHNMGSVEELCDNIALINKSEKILDGNVRDIRRQFSGQLYQVEISGEHRNQLDQMIDKRFELVQTHQHNGLIRLRIRLNEQHTANDLLRSLLDKAHIISFNEHIPSMNDIFIKKVTGEFPQEQKDESQHINTLV